MRALLQNPLGEMNWAFIIGFLALLVFSIVLALVIPILVRLHSPEYGQGGGRDINSWMDDRLVAKLMKILDKFDIEKKLGNKKSQKLSETIDKNERKRAVLALCCLIITRLPGHAMAIAFDRACRYIKGVIVRTVVLTKCKRQKFMMAQSEILRSLSRSKSMLWNILSI